MHPGDGSPVRTAWSEDGLLNTPGVFWETVLHDYADANPSVSLLQCVWGSSGRGAGLSH